MACPVLKGFWLLCWGQTIGDQVATGTPVRRILWYSRQDDGDSGVTGGGDQSDSKYSFKCRTSGFVDLLRLNTREEDRNGPVKDDWSRPWD